MSKKLLKKKLQQMLKQVQHDIVFSAFVTLIFADAKNKGNFGRNEPPSAPDILILKNFPQRLFICILMILLGSSSQAQHQVEEPHTHDHNAYHKIERAYQDGKLNINQKVLYKFYATQSPQKLPTKYQPQKSSILKCGTPAISDYHRSKSRLSASSIREVESMIGSSQMQSETYQSPSGLFEIHYETTGSHAVPAEDENNNGTPDYVEEVAAAADSSYNHQVQDLGYSNPIPAGESYAVEIRNLETFYGQTYTTGNGTAIQIENDFAEDFPTNDDPEGDQIGAVKATMAHEFKHAVQYEANSWRGETGNWLEMDATLMEEVTYDPVNDYYNYIREDESIFNSPSSSFYPGSYYHMTWALYFEEKYGSEFWVEVWQIIEANPQISMVDALTQQLGGSEAFTENYITSQLWHYASGPENSSPDYGFEESANYPAPPIDTKESLYNQNFTIPRSAPQAAPDNFAAKYFDIPLPDNPDGNIRLETSAQNENKGVGLLAYYHDGRVESSSIPLSSNQSTFKMPNINWNNVSRLGLVLTNAAPTSSSSDSMQVRVGSNNFDNTLSHNYPNPFNSTTQIRFTLEETSNVILKVFDTSGRLVTTLIDDELTAGLYEPTFDGTNLASGIYLYQLIVDGQNIVKKMTLIK